MLETSCCASNSDNPYSRVDWLFWGTFAVILPSYILWALGWETIGHIAYLNSFVESVYDLIHVMWWGILLGVFFVGLLSVVPKEFVMKALGNKPGVGGVLRATGAGLMLDLCSHGILLVACKLYERGARLSQVIAFLVASPWNSISLTVILVSLIGLGWTMVFVGLSAVVAVATGLIFEQLVKRKILPDNPNTTDLPEDFQFFKQARKQLASARLNKDVFARMARQTYHETRMIIRWMFLGIILVSLMRAFIPQDMFGEFLGPTASGLMLTIIFATVLEVCSEGLSPIAADILNRAFAPGNAFAFLMAGVATDYTEIMALKETTKSWKISLFLPLVTLPQIIVLGYLLNQM